MTADQSNRAFVLAGGGTGGHIFPNLAIAEQLESLIGRRPRCVFAVSARPLDAQILKDESREFEVIPAEPFVLRPRGFLKFLNSWGRSVRAARELLQKLKRDHGRVDVVATGGFVSAPVAQAARVERVPVTLVNLDATPGRANRWIARHAARVFTAAEASSVGWPVIRPLVRAAAMAPGDARACRKKLGLDPDRPVLFVTGASQGAGTINKLLVALVEKHTSDFVSRGWQVIHQTGPRTDAKDIENSRGAMKSAGIPAIVEPFFREMGVAWGAADLAISRSGAGSVAEAWANATPSVFLPYPYHKDQHQRANAVILLRAGACVVEDDLIDPEKNAGRAGATLLELMRDDAKREAMRAALKSLGPADGANTVARALVGER
ncbi:MAG: UDP-N-acetylglucosamine--N-acetylmuramyl-(pentapeptide) pyrophosphoryl-undecaprenol N-acetylglucosamine transferase [Phycisphaerales bacterium]|nr:UDP-N-acetylglucosamine--N-acetylmuramyl-(pentapeptide) pyrophosphoryl-undecaprenol N-acetylglucosamine transferase [Phycisphaerales bacterium]